jgi:hypothetical protein
VQVLDGLRWDELDGWCGDLEDSSLIASVNMTAKNAIYIAPYSFAPV